MLLDHMDIFGIATWIGAACLLAPAVFVLVCLRDGKYSERASSIPYCLTALLVFGLINPFGDTYRRNRHFFLQILNRVVLPFREVTFSDFLLADILTSLAKPLSDLSIASCRMLNFDVAPRGLGRGAREMAEGSGLCRLDSWFPHFILALPFIWRLLQCVRVYRSTREVPNLANALKYFSALPVIYLYSLRFTMPPKDWDASHRGKWLAFALLNSSFCYYWDLTWDWEFGICSMSRGGGLLRTENVYSGIGIWALSGAYTWAIVSNLLLRFVWLYKLSPMMLDLPFISLASCLLEVFRRFQWTYIRIEVALLKESRAASIAH